MSTQLIKLNQYIVETKPQFIETVKSSGLTLVFERECSFAMQILKENSYVAKIAEKNPESLKTALINCANMGLTLNTSQQLSYLVPRGDKICYDIGYRGLIALGVRDGAIVAAAAEVVREDDEFVWAGAFAEPVHKFKPFCKERKQKPMIGVYVVARLPSGGVIVDKLDAEDVEKAKKCSSMKDKSIWRDWDEDMWKKTGLKHASKLWPKGGDKYSYLARAVDYLNIQNEEGFKKPVVNADALTDVLNNDSEPANDENIIDVELQPIDNEEPMNPDEEPKPQITRAQFVQNFVDEHELHDMLDFLLQIQNAKNLDALTPEKQSEVYKSLLEVAKKKKANKLNKEQSE